MRGSHFVLSFLFLVIADKSLAQCSCTHLACEVCVEAVLPGIESAAKAAFNALEQSQEALDRAIEAGKKAEITAINYYEQDVVAALMANASAVKTEVIKSSVAESSMIQAQMDAYERLERSDSVARMNHSVAAHKGFENVSYANKLLYSAQAEKVLSKDGEPTGDIATIGFLLGEFGVRTREYTQEIIQPEVDSYAVSALDMSIIYQSGLSGGAIDSVVPQIVIPEALAIRRFMVAPTSIQTNMRAVDAKQGDDSGYWRFNARAKVAAEFLAWDLAIRTETPIVSGKTSLLHFLKETTEHMHSGRLAIMDEASADRRELIESIASATAISNLLDLLLLDVGRKQVNMQAAKIGYHNENAFNPVYGAVNPALTIDTAVRKGKANDQ